MLLQTQAQTVRIHLRPCYLHGPQSECRTANNRTIRLFCMKEKQIWKEEAGSATCPICSSLRSSVEHLSRIQTGQNIRPGDITRTTKLFCDIKQCQDTFCCCGYSDFTDFIGHISCWILVPATDNPRPGRLSLVGTAHQSPWLPLLLLLPCSIGLICDVGSQIKQPNKPQPTRTIKHV